jgi:mono/diheme cytochrome c family protein
MTFAFHRGSVAFFAMLAASALNSAASADEAALALGKKLFLEGAEPSCAICHTLADAGSIGKVGPILDDLRPTGEQVAAAVTNGVGVMPPYEALTKAEVDALAEYVSRAVKGR